MNEVYESIISMFHDDKKNSPYERSKEYAAALWSSLRWKSTTEESVPEWYKKSDNPENISWFSPLSKEPERYQRDMKWMPEPER